MKLLKDITEIAKPAPGDPQFLDKEIAACLVHPTEFLKGGKKAPLCLALLQVLSCSLAN